MGQPFIGRDEVRDLLVDAWADAGTGRGGLLWVSGEAGIGKTRVLGELGDLAEEATVLRGSGWEDPGTPAFWLWTQVLRGAAATGDPASWPAEARSLLDGVSVALDAAGRFPLFDAVTQVISGLPGPVAVLLDDVHWADQGSLRLLRFLAPVVATSHVLIACGWRSGEAELGEDVAEVMGRSRVVELTGLRGDDVATLIESASGIRVAQDDAAAVAAQTGGNPLFVQEMARLAAARGSTSVAGTVPASATATIRRRIARISQPANDLLVALAIAGNGAGLDLLAVLLDAEVDDVAAVLDEVVVAGLVTTDDDRPAFAHALVRAAVTDGLPASRQRVLHLAAAEHLDGRASPAEVARHLFAALPLAPVDRLLVVAEDAARSSTAMQAHEDAAETYRKLLELVGSGPDRPRLLLARGESLLAAGDLTGARTAYVEAAELARQDDDSDGFARAALGFAAGLGGFEVRLGDHTQLDLLEEALVRLPDQDSELRAFVLARLSVAAAYSDTPERRGRLADEAVAMARRLDGRQCLAHALAAHCDAIAGPDDAERREQEASEIVALARDGRDRAAELLGLRLRIVARLEQGDVVGAETDVRAFARIADTLHQPLYSWYVPLWRGYFAQLAGDLDEVARCAAEAGRIGRLVGSHNAFALSMTQQMWLDIERVDVEGLRTYIDRMTAEVPEMVPLEVSIFSVFPGQPDHVRRAFLPHLAETLDEMPKDDSEWLSFLAHATTALFEGNDQAEYAQVLYGHLLPHRHRYVVDGIAAASLGSAERSLGMLAALMGAHADAADHFTRALEADARVGSVVHPAATHRAHGLMLVRAGDRDAAAPHLRLAREAYHALGVAARVVELDDLLGGLPAADVGDAVFRRDGAVWTLSYRGTTTTVRHAKGIADLAVLLADPGRETHVLDLAGASSAPAQADLGPTLDDHARLAYRRRINELDEAVAEGDEAAADEREALLAELSSAYGLGGRARRAGSDAERARSAVTRRIRDAIRTIEQAHPELGRHLRVSVRTGAFCSYQPETEQRWLTT
ncbi:MAG TPA: AAA family ATPase [Marmoricola sp.]|nr:AAA family ATPase [Marmoricola sp.]